MEPIDVKQNFRITYTISPPDPQVIPAFNFYPCLVLGLNEAGMRITGRPFDTFDCDQEGVQWHIEPGAVGMVNAGIKRVYVALSSTIRKFQVPAVDFTVEADSGVKAKGSIRYTGAAGTLPSQ